ncbi:unnamed protein product [Moneuplotes crassus]|uniref:Uncharacterized protein n=1 Tax=Euplotes crassus TaxID=5936 RepID=A0AAD1XCS5_EUPCR|nr:unnamed protein product [Moneuplotes crassus]
MESKYCFSQINPETTTKENCQPNIHPSSDAMRKTNLAHSQLNSYLTASHQELAAKKPAKESKWDSSVIFNKYLKIGDLQGSVLTSSSLSSTSQNLPLQISSTSNSAASKAITSLQSKVDALTKENDYLRDLLADSKTASGTYKFQVEQLQSALTAAPQREQELQQKLQKLEDEHQQVIKYADTCSERIKLLESRRNDSFDGDISQFPEFQQKVQEYESVIERLEHQRSESIQEIEKMRQELQEVNEVPQKLQPKANYSQKSFSSGSSDNKLENSFSNPKSKKESKKLREQLFQQKKDHELKINNLKRKHKLEVEGYKQECSLKDKEIERMRKELQRLKKIAKNVQNITNLSTNARKVPQKQAKKKPETRRSKVRGNSTNRSRSKDVSWVKRNQHLFTDKRKSRAKSRCSGIPLSRKKSSKKRSERGSKKRLIVNLECPPEWTNDDSNSIDNALSKSISVDNSHPIEVIKNISSTPSSVMNSNSQLHHFTPSVSHPNFEDAHNTSQHHSKESEMYQTFLEMIKQRTQEGNEIKIEH